MTSPPFPVCTLKARSSTRVHTDASNDANILHTTTSVSLTHCRSASGDCFSYVSDVSPCSSQLKKFLMVYLTVRGGRRLFLLPMRHCSL